MSGGGITAAANAFLNLVGSTNTASLSTGDTVGAYGGDNTIDAGADEKIYIDGTEGEFDLVVASNDQNNVQAAGDQPAGIFLGYNDQVNVVGSTDYVSLGSGDAAGVFGGANTITAQAEVALYLNSTLGNFDLVTASNEQNTVLTADGQASGISLAANTQVNIVGSTDDVELATGDAAGVYGGDNTITAQADVDLYLSSTNGNFDLVTASNEQSSVLTADGQPSNIGLAANTQVNLVGSSDDLGLATGDAAGVYGGANTITAQADVDLYLSSTNGNFDLVTASNEQSTVLTGDGQPSNIGLAANTQVNLVGSSDDLGLATGDAAGVYGGANTITAQADVDLYLSSTNDNFDHVTASNEQNNVLTADGQASDIGLAADTQVNIFGSTDDVGLATGDTAGVYGGDNTITAQADTCIVLGTTNDSSDLVVVSGDLAGGEAANGQGTGVDLNSNTQAYVSGSGDTVILATGDSAAVSGGGDVIDAQAGDFVYASDTDSNFDTVVASDDQSNVDAADGEVAGITLASDTQANIVGSSDAITLNAGDSAGVYGGGNTINAGADMDVYIGETDGASDTVNASGDQNNVEVAAYNQLAGITVGGNDEVDVYGSSDTVSLGSGDSAGVYGGGNTVNAGAGQAVQVGNTGSDIDTINAVEDQAGATAADGTATGMIIDADAQANLFGDDDTITMNAGSYIGIQGGAGYSIYAYDATIATAADTSFNLWNGSDTVYLGASSYVGLQGGGVYSVFASNDTIATAANTSFNLWNGSDTVYLGASSYVGLQGGGVYSVFASNDTIATAANTSFNLWNGSDTVYLGASSYVGLQGSSGYSVYASGDAIATAGTTDFSLFGSDDTVTLGVASGATIVGSGSTVELTTDDGLTASGETVNIGGGVAMGAITGSDNTVNVSSGDALGLVGSGDVVSGSGASVTFGADTLASFENGGNTVGLTGNDSLNASGETVEIGGNVNMGPITGADNVVYVGSGDELGLVGSGDEVKGSGASVTFGANTLASFDNGGNIVGLTGNDSLNASGETVEIGGNVGLGAITGANNAVYVGNGDQLSLVGSGDVVSGSGASVTLGANTLATFNNGGDSIGLATNDTLNASGETVSVGNNVSMGPIEGSNNVVQAGSGDNFSLSGDYDTVSEGSSSIVDLIAGDQHDTVDASNDSIPIASNVVVTVNGTGDTVDAFYGENGDTIYANNDTIRLGSYVDVTVVGSNDRIDGSSNDTIDANGMNDPVSANNSDVVYFGTDTGDYVSGAGDSGSDWAGNPTQDGGDDGWGDSGSGFGVAANTTKTMSVVAQYDLGEGYTAASVTSDTAWEVAETGDRCSRRSRDSGTLRLSTLSDGPDRSLAGASPPGRGRPRRPLAVPFRRSIRRSSSRQSRPGRMQRG